MMSVPTQILDFESWNTSQHLSITVRTVLPNNHHTVCTALCWVMVSSYNKLWDAKIQEYLKVQLLSQCQQTIRILKGRCCWLTLFFQSPLNYLIWYLLEHLIFTFFYIEVTHMLLSVSSSTNTTSGHQLLSLELPCN